MIHEEQPKILKNLILEYQKTKDQQIFIQILERVDRALIGMVIKISKLYYFNEPNIQDLYQTAILGLYNAVASVSEKSSPRGLMQRIYIYVRKEIFQTYGEEKVDYENMPSYGFGKDLNPPVDRNLIQEDNRNILASLVTDNVITKSEYELLVLRFVQEKSIGKIIKEKGTIWGKTWKTVDSRIKNILSRIRCEFRSKGFLS